MVQDIINTFQLSQIPLFLVEATLELVYLATNSQILITFTHTVLPLILYNIWVCHCPGS